MIELADYRKEFPVTEHSIYLNNAGVGPPSLRFCQAVHDWLRSQAREGVKFDRWRTTAANCRRRLADLVGCDSHELAFVRNTSHGLAIVAEGLDWQEGQHIAVATNVEYPSNVHPWVHIAQEKRLIVDSIQSENGGVTVSGVANAINRSTRLVSVSSAQFSTGAVTDLYAIGALCKDKGILLCVDGIQTVGALPVDVRRAGIHFLAADSHKWMLGTMGIGFLFVDQALVNRIRPPLVGWNSMQNGWDFDSRNDRLRTDAGRFEEGSPSFALIAGLTAGLSLLQEVAIEKITTHLQALTQRLAAGLEALGCLVGPEARNREHILCFSSPKVAAETLVSKLEDRKIITAERSGNVRISPHFYNTEQEIDSLLDNVGELMRQTGK